MNMDTSNYECALEIRDAINGVRIEVQDLAQLVADHTDQLATPRVRERIDLLTRIVCAYISSPDDFLRTQPIGSDIEERRTICLLAGLWADSILAEATFRPAREP